MAFVVGRPGRQLFGVDGTSSFFLSLGTEACDAVALQDICDFEPLHVRDQSQRAPDAASTEAALPRAGLSLACASHAE